VDDCYECTGGDVGHFRINCNKGFTDVIEKAVKATMGHQTYIKDSYRKIDDSYFITQHTFPEDSRKRVEVHHLLFNLYFEKIRAAQNRGKLSLGYS